MQKERKKIARTHRVQAMKGEGMRFELPKE